MSALLSGKRWNCAVSNHLLKLCLSLGRAKFLPEKKESVPKTTGTPDWMLNWPESCHPPTTKSRAFGIDLPSACFPAIRIWQVGWLEGLNGPFSPPSLCSIFPPAISGPVHDVSSNSLLQVKELMIAKPLLNRCSTLASMASYWLVPHG